MFETLVPKSRKNLLAACALGVTAWLHPTFANAESRALLIGIGEYQDSRANLPGIDLDINIARKLAGKLGYRDSQIRVLSNQQVTRENIIREFKEMAQTVTSSDKVFIYYSGHGTQVQDTSGDEDDGYDEALTLYNLGSGEDFGVLIDDDINSLLRSLPSKNTTLMVDACCSGTAVKSLRLDGQAFPQGTSFIVKSASCPSAGSSRAFGVAEADTLANIVYLSAAQDTQASLASSRGSIFTLAVQDAFRAGTDLTPTQLLQKTDSFIAKRVPADRRFNPNLIGDKRLFDRRALFVVDNSAPSPGSDRPSSLGMFSQMVQDASGPVKLRTSKRSYTEGQELAVSVDMPFDGYLNLVAIDSNDDPILLFPNNWARKNGVRQGQLRLPLREFRWPAKPPHGDTYLMALVTRQPINFFETAHGRDQKGNVLADYLVPAEASLKELDNITKSAGGGYLANMIKVKTCRSGC